MFRKYSKRMRLLLTSFWIFISTFTNAEIISYVITEPLSGIQIDYAIAESLSESKKLTTKPVKENTKMSGVPMILTYDTTSKDASIKHAGGSDAAVCLQGKNTMTFILQSNSESIFGSSLVNQTYVVHLNHKKNDKYLVTLTSQKNVPISTSVSVFEGWAK